MLVRCALLMFLLHGSESSSFSHLSVVTANEKPILRSVPDSAEEIGSANKTESLKEPLWLKELRKKINYILNGYGLKEGKRHIKQLVKDAEKNNNILLHIKVNPSGVGVQSIEYKPALRTVADPEWLSDFKIYVRQLISSHGRSNINSRLFPVIKSIEKKHGIIIQDVDVNGKGKVFVDYTLRTKSRKRKKSKRMQEN